MDAESLITDVLSTLAGRTDEHTVSLGENMALLIAKKWEGRTPVRLPTPEVRDAVWAAQKEPWFTARAYKLWDSVNALAYDGHPPVLLSGRDALCVLALLCNDTLVGDARQHYHDLAREEGW